MLQAVYVWKFVIGCLGLWGMWHRFWYRPQPPVPPCESCELTISNVFVCVCYGFISLILSFGCVIAWATVGNCHFASDSSLCWPVPLIIWVITLISFYNLLSSILRRIVCPVMVITWEKCICKIISRPCLMMVFVVGPTPTQIYHF